MNDSKSLTEMIGQVKQVSELVVFSGRSGSGKTSLMNQIIKLYNGIELLGVYHWKPTHPLSIRKARKYTTRAQRPDDDPQEFIYVNRAKFEKLSDDGTIAVRYKSEGAGDVFYGWANSELTPHLDQIILTTANDEAVANDLRYLRRSTNIFIDVSHSVLVQRIRARGGTSEQIEARISRLGAEHTTLAYDPGGKEHALGMKSHFYGTDGQLEGAAHIILENCGSLDLAAEAVFKELLRLAPEKRNPCRIPERHRLKVGVRDGEDVAEIERLADEDYTRPGGKSFNRGNIINNDRKGYTELVTLGMFQGAIPSLGGPRYFVRISDMSDEIDVGAERSVMFRGCVLRPMESWGIPYGVKSRLLREQLVELGMNPRMRGAGNDYTGDIPVYSSYYDGVSPYGLIRQVFEEKGARRLV